MIKPITTIKQLFILCSFILVTNIIQFYVQTARQEHFQDRPRVEQLIDELTKSQDRQQKALDELMINLDVAEIYLCSHIFDDRKLASQNVNFLSISDNAFEKYRLSSAVTVNQVLVKLLCEYEKICLGRLGEIETKNFEMQQDSLVKLCKGRFYRSDLYCDVKTDVAL